jgi:excisionase family DNA binding protein
MAKNFKMNQSKFFLTPFSAEEVKNLVKQALSELHQEYPINDNEEDDEYLTQKEAAKFLKVSAPTIIKWKQENKIPYYQIGRTIKFKKSELLDSMKRNEKLIK